MYAYSTKLEFIALKRIASDCKAGICFSWCDTDKIKKCEARQTRSGWILKVGEELFGAHHARLDGAIKAFLIAIATISSMPVAKSRF